MAIHIRESGGLSPNFYGIVTDQFPLIETVGNTIYNHLKNSGFRVSVQQPTMVSDFPMQYVPYVSGIESSQYFIDKVKERHLLSGSYDWNKFSGRPYQQTYTPNITKPFSLGGYPLHEKEFWDNFKSNIIELGQELLQYWEYRPWSNYGNKTLWSGAYYSPKVNYAQSGYLPHTSGFLYYGRPNKEDYNQYIPNGSQSQPSFFEVGAIREYRWAQKILPRTNTTFSSQSCILSGVGRFITSTLGWPYLDYVISSSISQNGINTIVTNKYYGSDIDFNLTDIIPFIFGASGESNADYDSYELSYLSDPGSDTDSNICSTSFNRQTSTIGQHKYFRDFSGIGVPSGGRGQFGLGSRIQRNFESAGGYRIEDLATLSSKRITKAYAYPTFNIYNSAEYLSNIRNFAGIISSGIMMYGLNTFRNYSIEYSNGIGGTEWGQPSGLGLYITNNKPVEIYYGFSESGGDVYYNWLNGNVVKWGQIDLSGIVTTYSGAQTIKHISGYWGQNYLASCYECSSSGTYDYTYTDDISVLNNNIRFSGRLEMDSVPFDNMGRYKFLTLYLDQKHAEYTGILPYYNKTYRAFEKFGKEFTVLSGVTILNTASVEGWGFNTSTDLLCPIQCFPDYYSDENYQFKGLNHNFPRPEYYLNLFSLVRSGDGTYHLNIDGSYFEIEQPTHIYSGVFKINPYVM